MMTKTGKVEPFCRHKLRALAAFTFILMLGCGVFPAQAGEALDGDWQGAISIMGQQLGIKAHFKTTADALTITLDIPQQGATGLPMQNVSYSHPEIHFEIPGAAVAAFDGTVDGNNISGDFLQSGMKGSFTLQRAEDDTHAESDAAAVNTPEATGAEALPYLEEEVSFSNGDTHFAGTLTVPAGKGPFPAAIMISGSGPQNRDEELFGFKPFKVIADHLTRAGIAVLRYDDRGVGGSTGSVATSTSQDFAGDVLAAAHFLKQRADIDGSKVGAIGHSEGAIVAPIAAQSGELAFAVLLAGSSMKGSEVLLDQGEQILRAGGATDAQLLEQRQVQEMIFAAVRSDEGWEEVEAVITKQIREELAKAPEAQRAAIPDPDQFIKTQVDAQINGVRSPWLRSFIDYDPAPALEAMQIPVLALFGELDLQVPAVANSAGMEKAFAAGGNKRARIEILAGANHLFQSATTGSPAEYATLDKAFVPELLPLLVSWIKSLI